MNYHAWKHFAYFMPSALACCDHAWTSHTLFSITLVPLSQPARQMRGEVSRYAAQQTLGQAG